MDAKLIANFFLFLVFLYASLGTIAGHGFDRYRWIYYTRPVIMPVLVLYYLLNMNQPNPIIIMAMLCAFTTDFLRMLPMSKKYFLLGLLSFFLMQILYLVFIRKDQLELIVFSAPAIIMAGMYLLLAVLIMFLLYRYLESFLLLLLVNILFLLILSYFCFLNVMDHKTEIAFVQYMGSLLLLISDIIFTFDSFRKPLRFGGIYIMITYIVAQIFLISGFMNT